MSVKIECSDHGQGCPCHDCPFEVLAVPIQMHVTLPTILADAVGTRTIDVNGHTPRDVMVELRTHPKLGPLIFDESKRLRPHVIFFVNDTAAQHLASLDEPLKRGDRLAILQAVSGG